MVRAIVDAVDPEQVILFGSRARGSDIADSDVDLLIVPSEPFGAGRSRHKEIVRAYEALSGMRVAKDILMYSRPEVEYWRDSLNHAVARAQREGRVLYKRPGMPASPQCSPTS
ncbi:MAG: nucleotidyltransferase domain-containing protein [Acidobacteriia bacterium]|nr:nucleotidyltransferase domain-containing protein [Terriglobia bacterium]